MSSFAPRCALGAGRGAARWLAIGLAIGLSGCAAGPTPEELSAAARAADPFVLPAPREVSEPIAREAKAVYFYLLGQFMIRERDWAGAEKAFTLLTELDPDAVEAHLVAAQLATRRGDLTVALKHGEEVLRLEPGNLRIRLMLAGIYTAIKEYGKAGVHYAAVLEENPDHVQARLLLAQVYGLEGKIAQVKKLLAPMFGQIGLAWRAHLAMGRAYVAQNNLKAAIQSFREAYRRAPDQLETVLALGAALQDADRGREAERIYRAYLSDNPDNMAIHGRLGALLLTKNEVDSALKEFRAIVAIAPNSVQARLTTALILLNREQHEEALRELRLAEAVEPGNSGIRYYLGQTLEGMEQNADAAEEYRKVEADQPLYLESQIRLSFVEMEGAHPAEAVQRLEKLLPQHEKRPELFFALSVGYMQTKNYAKVVEAVALGLALDPNLHRLRLNRAMALDKLERWPEAEKDLVDFLRHHPDDPHALNYLGYSWADRGERLEEARGLLGKAVKLAPGDGFIADSYGWVLYRLKRYSEALSYLKEAVRLESADPVIHDHLGDILEALGRREEAIKAWKRSLELDPASQSVKEKLQRHAPAPPPAP
ncbi:MAG: tetratricopeptide repeat protein [Magnetococcales bacterium]|nr:tetratricopeptide repeat protein [Magnetococcales bacterium]